jgi:hypothetical protein
MPVSVQLILASGLGGGGGSGATLANDESTNASFYPTLSATTTGNFTTATVSTTKLYFNPSTGQLNATIFNSLSDRAMKKDVEVIEQALNSIKQIQGVRFNWVENDKPSYGFIAQDIEPIIPEIVSRNENDTLSLNYDAVIAFLVEAIKELSSRVEQLERS